jgi:hypothetical protein
VKERANVGRLGRDRQAIDLDPGEGEKVVDQAAEALRFGRHHGEVAARGGRRRLVPALQ